MNKLRIF